MIRWRILVRVVLRVYMFNRLWRILIPSRLALTILVGGEKTRRHREYMSNDHLWILYLISVTQASWSWSRIRSRARESAGGFEWSIYVYIYNSVCICSESIICDAYDFVPYRNFYLRNTGIKVTVTFTRIRRRVRVVNLQMQYRVYTICQCEEYSS